jgi:hypothetical protein
MYRMLLKFYWHSIHTYLLQKFRDTLIYLYIHHYTHISIYYMQIHLGYIFIYIKASLILLVLTPRMQMKRGVLALIKVLWREINKDVLYSKYNFMTVIYLATTF